MTGQPTKLQNTDTHTEEQQTLHSPPTLIHRHTQKNQRIMHTRTSKPFIWQKKEEVVVFDVDCDASYYNDAENNNDANDVVRSLSMPAADDDVQNTMRANTLLYVDTTKQRKKP